MSSGHPVLNHDPTTQSYCAAHTQETWRLMRIRGPNSRQARSESFVSCKISTSQRFWACRSLGEPPPPPPPPSPVVGTVPPLFQLLGPRAARFPLLLPWYYITLQQTVVALRKYVMYIVHCSYGGSQCSECIMNFWETAITRSQSSSYRNTKLFLAASALPPPRSSRRCYTNRTITGSQFYWKEEIFTDSPTTEFDEREYGRRPPTRQPLRVPLWALLLLAFHFLLLHYCCCCSLLYYCIGLLLLLLL